MDTFITALSINELDQFFLVFTEILSNQFPGYTPKVIDYMLKKAYTKENFRYWIQNGYKTVLVAYSVILGSEATPESSKLDSGHASQQGEQARMKKDIIGFVVIDQPYGGVSFCRWLGILRPYQKQGIGTSLINQWVELAKKENAHKVEVAAQPEAKGFYEKIGLALEGHRKLSYFGIDQYIFGKVIGTPTDENMTKY